MNHALTNDQHFLQQKAEEKNFVLGPEEAKYIVYTYIICIFIILCTVGMRSCVYLSLLTAWLGQVALAEQTDMILETDRSAYLERRDFRPLFLAQNTDPVPYRNRLKQFTNFFRF